MRALALLAVFVIAKLVILSGRPIQLSVWTPIAYFWQDVLVALMFCVLDRVLGRASLWRRVLCWVAYGVCVFYVAINVPIERVLSSPLTWSMLGATGGALSDSIKYHATPTNLLLMSLVAASGAVFPVLLCRTEFKVGATAIVSALSLVALGPAATSRVETLGLGRNPVIALAATTLPHILARTSSPAFAHAIEGEDAATWRARPSTQDVTAEDGSPLAHLSSAAAGRNVVLILLESTGAEYLRPYGASQDPMPYLTRLADEAVVFENAYSVYPESIKGLFSVLCSRYPAMGTDAENYARVVTPSIASMLEGAGYRTALFHSGRFMYLGMDAVVANRGYQVLEDAGAIGGNRESSFGVDEPSTVGRALSWIDSLERGERFFLTYLPIAGHHPYETPEPGPFGERAEKDRYLNALHYADEALGMLIDGLRARGVLQNTVLVIFGDHGEAFEQHEGNYGHSLLLYEENIHVPYFIVAPELIKQHVRINRTISLIDTAPTILDLVGLHAPGEFQGESALAQHAGTALFLTDYSLSLMGLRDGRWKYIYEADSERSKLFDMAQDSAESKDLSPFSPERVATYRGLLLRWSAAQKVLLESQVRGEQGLR